MTSVAIHYGRDDVKVSSHVHTRQITAAAKMRAPNTIFLRKKTNSKKTFSGNLRAGGAAAWHDEGHRTVFDGVTFGDLGSEHVVAAWLRTAACANNAATRQFFL